VSAHTSFNSEEAQKIESISSNDFFTQVVKPSNANEIDDLPRGELVGDSKWFLFFSMQGCEACAESKEYYLKTL